MIAQHLEAAGDLHAAFGWHMRAANWFTFRNFAAAHSSWLRARHVADRLPDDDPGRLSMRIAPRALLCAHEYRIRSGHADEQFAELKELCAVAGDKRSLAIGLAGVALATQLDGPRPAAPMAAELFALGLSRRPRADRVALRRAADISIQGGKIGRHATGGERHRHDRRQANRGELITISPVASALAMRGIARWSKGLPGWREDFKRAFEIVSAIPPAFARRHVLALYLDAVPNGVLMATQAVVDDAAEMLAAAEQFGEQITFDLAKAALGISLMLQHGADRDGGARLLQELHELPDRGAS